MRGDVSRKKGYCYNILWLEQAENVEDYDRTVDALLKTLRWQSTSLTILAFILSR